MNISRQSTPHKLVDYFVLPNGKADVFLRRNEIVETKTDDEGNEYEEYVADEVYFQVDVSVPKTEIEANFEQLWNDVENPKVELTETEKLKTQLDAVQGALDFIIMNY